MEQEHVADGPDFSAFFLEETSAIDLELPNGEPMLYDGAQVRVHLYGPATDRYQRASDAMQREAMRRAVAVAGQKKRKKQAEAEDSDADLRWLLAVTQRFESFPYPGGAEAIYREPRLRYIADQVRAHLADLGNFFRPGETT